MVDNVICEEEKFQCRRCRFVLFKWKDLSELHTVTSECSLWFLRDDDMLPWVQDLVNESGWTKGKLYCPQCEARIGAFDFIHVITCGCQKESIPSVYCVQSKIDHAKVIHRNQNILRVGETGDHSYGREFENEKTTEENEDCEQNTNSYERIELTEFSRNFRKNSQDSIESIDRYEILNSMVLEENGAPVKRELVKEEESFAVHINEPDLDDMFVKLLDGTKSSAKTNRASNNQLQELFQSTEIPFLESSEIQLRSTPSASTSPSFTDDIEQPLRPDEPEDPVIMNHTGSTSVFNNPCFDPNESDNEDYLVNATALTECRRNTRKTTFYGSHRAAPHVLTCLRCRDSYERFLQRSEQRRINRSCICDQGCGNMSNNESSENENSADRNTIRPCTCANNRQFEIYNDLMSVRQDMANLQDLIQTTTEFWPTETRHRRNKRRRQRNRLRRDGRDVYRDATDYSSLVNLENESQESDVDIPDNFQCPVCLDVYYEPHVTECSHTFCSPCLRQLNKTSNRRPLCPLCRRQLFEVEYQENLHNDVKRLYPKSYRKRYLIERRRTINQFPLPSRTSVRFEREPSYFSTRLVHILNVARTFLIVLFMFITFAINREGRNNRFNRQSTYARLFFVLLMALICTFVGTLVGLFVAFYAYDLFKYLVGFVLFYVVIVKYAMAVVHE